MARTVNKTYEHQKAEVERITGSRVCFSHDRDGERSIAYVLIGNTVIVALAKCSPRDNFCRATGRLVAVGRLYNYLYHAEPTKHVFKFKAVTFSDEHVDGLYNLWVAISSYPDVVESEGLRVYVYLPEKWFRTNNADVDKDTTETSIVPEPTQPEQEVRTFFGSSESSLRHYVENLNDQIAGLKAEIESLTDDLKQETTNAEFWEQVAADRLNGWDNANKLGFKFKEELEEAREEAESWESKARSQARVIETLRFKNQKLTKELQEAREEADYWLRAYDEVVLKVEVTKW